MVQRTIFQADGVAGDLTNFELLNPLTANPPQLKGLMYTIQEVWFELYGFTLALGFEASPGVMTPVWYLTPGASLHHDWKGFGGLIDSSNPLNATGRLLCSTNGFTSPSCVGTMVISCKKVRGS